jgi:hypothetical protein
MKKLKIKKNKDQSKKFEQLTNCKTAYTNSLDEHNGQFTSSFINSDAYKQGKLSTQNIMSESLH